MFGTSNFGTGVNSAPESLRHQAVDFGTKGFQANELTLFPPVTIATFPAILYALLYIIKQVFMTQFILYYV